STRTVRPASFIQPTTRSRPWPSSAVSANRQLPPLGVAPIFARSISDCQSRLPSMDMVGVVIVKVLSGKGGRSPRCQRVGPDGGQRLARGDAVGVVAEFEQGGQVLPFGKRTGAGKRGPEIGSALYGFAVAAIALDNLREVRVVEAQRDVAAGKIAFLVGADRAPHAVIEQQNDDAQPVLHGYSQFLHIHLEAAVARIAHHR